MMKIRILAKPGSRRVGIERRDDGVLLVRVRERAVDGRANEAVRKIIAMEFGCRASDVIIRTGVSSRYKTVEVPE